MATKEEVGERPPSRIGRVQVTAHVDGEVRRALKAVALEQDVTLQHLLCVAINDLLEKFGHPRLADESMLPRGGAARRHVRRIVIERAGDEERPPPR